MSNPALNERVLKDSFNSLVDDSTMSISGTIVKTVVLMLFLSSTFAYNWYLIALGFMDKANMLGITGMIAAFVLCLIICFAPKNKFLIVTTPMYALCEGLGLGWISAIANSYFPGVVSQAAIGTIFAAFVMLFLYSTKIIKCTPMFMKVIYTATASVFGIYLLQMILNFCHVNALNVLFSSSPIGIAFSVIVVIIAAFNLIVDFEVIKQCDGQVNKDMEWYFGFSLMVTIVWLYIEILDLLMKLRDR